MAAKRKAPARENQTGGGDEVLTAAQAAEILQLNERTVRNLLNESKLPGTRIGREWRLLRSEVYQHVRDGFERSA